MRHTLLVVLPSPLVIALLCLCTTLATSSAYSATKRGDAPACQEECFAEHQRQMGRLIKDFEGKRNKFEFQDAVEEAVARYRYCIESCRELQPVK